MPNTSLPSEPLLGPWRSALLVDDDEFSREVLGEMLESLGFTDIQRSTGGRGALNALAKMPNSPDVLICDVYMPDMDGVEFLEQLGKLHYAKSVILVSGAQSDMLSIVQDVARADGVKVLGALRKPLRIEILANTLGIFR